MATPSNGERNNEAAVGPLVRGLHVVRALAAAADEAPTPGAAVPTARLARVTGLPRSTVDRAVLTLAACGIVRTAGHYVALAPGAAALGNAYLSSCHLPAAFAAVVQELADRFDESVSVAVPDGLGVRFVTQVPRRRTTATAFRVGDLLPAERCAPGALFAAAWSDQSWHAWRSGFAPGRPAETFPGRVARSAAAGFALDDQLVEPGLVAVAVDTTRFTPLPDAAERGQFVEPAALSVVSHTSRHTAASLADHVLGAVREASSRAAAALASPSDQAEGRSTAGVVEEGAFLAAAARMEDEQTLGTTGRAARTSAGQVRSLSRGLAVLTAFDAVRRTPALSELASATGLPRATVRRSLLTLVRLGYAAAQDGRFRLLPRVLELGYAPLTRMGLAELAEPELRALAAAVGESVSLTVLSGDEILYLARIPVRRIMTVDVGAGSRLPAYPTSTGRVLLAGLGDAELTGYLSRVAPAALTRRTETDPRRLRRIVTAAGRDGFSLVTEELEDGLQAIAVPVRDTTGRPVAAVNVSMNARRMSPEAARRDLLVPLRATATAIAGNLSAVSAFRTPPPSDRFSLT
ncbi:IclR family transcriptional regulator C-terminal domain-containing protein [Frankia sp. QA3]|uniref:IclR family transcriptional regulator domain-containing protein n=1 Tax=Frankia sp. QA3 TaxID=710111 RepID=UPI000269BDF5|nr:IclR family transcriptional regulator C-terminal domain-containing protein [Frankia sp. QA3]EIV92834.1 transcriptional regulator [Frankia sp. QA3]